MSFAIRFLALCAVLALGIVAPSAAQATTKIVLLGDSLVAGYGIRLNEALPEKLEKKLVELGYDVEVINGGVSGDTTSGGRSRLRWLMDRHAPDIVFIALGSNDMLRHVTPDVTYNNIAAIISDLQAREVPHIVLMRVVAPENYGPEYAQTFNDIFTTLSHYYGVPLYPYFLEEIFGRSDLMQTDGVHPNSFGMDVIAEHLTDYFVETGWVEKIPGFRYR